VVIFGHKLIALPLKGYILIVLVFFAAEVAALVWNRINDSSRALLGGRVRQGRQVVVFGHIIVALE
jgi:hypothetical protein